MKDDEARRDIQGICVFLQNNWDKGKRLTSKLDSVGDLMVKLSVPILAIAVAKWIWTHP